MVDYFPNKMVKQWGILNLNDRPELIEETLPQLKLLKTLYANGQRVGNLQGDGFVLRLVNDGQPVDQPIDFASIQEVRYSRVFGRNEIIPVVNEQYSSVDFYHPELFQVPKLEGTGFEFFHSDRVIRFTGAFLTPRSFRHNGYHYASVLKAMYGALQDLTEALDNAVKGLRSFEFLKFAIENLLEIVMENDEVEMSRINARLKKINDYLSVDYAVAYDKDREAVEVGSRNFTGVQGLIEVVRQELIGASGLSKVQLYNEHPSGMNSTGKSQLLTDAEKVKELQELKWTDNIELDCKLLLAPYGVVDGFSWEWLNTYQPTIEEEVSLRSKNADIDQKYVNMGAIAPEEVRQRFTQSQYQYELVIDDKLPDVLQEQIDFKQEQNKVMLENMKGNSKESEDTDNKQLKQDAQEQNTSTGKFKPEGKVLDFAEYSPIDVETLMKMDIEDQDDI